MPLTKEQVKALLQRELNKPKNIGKKPKNFVDTSVRDYATWFKLAHKLYDENTGGHPLCSNPNCQDTRPPEKKMVADVEGTLMCRTCFLAGYSSIISGQVKLPNGPNAD